MTTDSYMPHCNQAWFTLERIEKPNTNKGLCKCKELSLAMDGVLAWLSNDGLLQSFVITMLTPLVLSRRQNLDLSVTYNFCHFLCPNSYDFLASFYRIAQRRRHQPLIPELSPGWWRGLPFRPDTNCSWCGGQRRYVWLIWGRIMWTGNEGSEFC